MSILLDGGSAPGTPIIPTFAGSTDWMSGAVSSYNPTTGALVASIVAKQGTSAYSAWDIYRAPTPGTSMVKVGVSTSTQAIATGTVSMTIAVGLDLSAGDAIYIIYASAAGLNETGMVLYLAAQQLQDQTGQTWDASVLVPYLNLFFLEVMNLKPDAYPTTRTIGLVAGAAQALPSDAIRLIDVVSNMGVSGTVRGTPVHGIAKDSLDDLVPDWMTAAANAVVKFVVTDDRNPKKFHVYPPQPAVPGTIEAVLSVAPPMLTSVDGTFPFDKGYIPPAVDYVVGRALSEETTIPNAMAKGTLYINRFMQGLGLRTNQEAQDNSKGK